MNHIISGPAAWKHLPSSIKDQYVGPNTIVSFERNQGELRVNFCDGVVDVFVLDCHKTQVPNVKETWTHHYSTVFPTLSFGDEG